LRDATVSQLTAPTSLNRSRVIVGWIERRSASSAYGRTASQRHRRRSTPGKMWLLRSLPRRGHFVRKTRANVSCWPRSRNYLLDPSPTVCDPRPNLALAPVSSAMLVNGRPT